MRTDQACKNLTTWLSIQCLSGQPFSGPDIGGFAGNATPKLFGRWMGVGALFPFSRGHTETGSIDHEPWSFGEEVLHHATQTAIQTCVLKKTRNFCYTPRSLIHCACFCFTAFHLCMQYMVDGSISVSLLCSFCAVYLPRFCRLACS